MDYWWDDEGAENADDLCPECGRSAWVFIDEDAYALVDGSIETWTWYVCDFCGHNETIIYITPPDER
jgi:hypothetical protein